MKLKTKKLIPILITGYVALALGLLLSFYLLYAFKHYPEWVSAQTPEQLFLTYTQVLANLVLTVVGLWMVVLYRVLLRFRKTEVLKLEKAMDKEMKRKILIYSISLVIIIFTLYFSSFLGFPVFILANFILCAILVWLLVR
jgi:heme/copper-type cytochrome/quinol oxidase subunit 2